jgi:hypothetical protein
LASTWSGPLQHVKLLDRFQRKEEVENIFRNALFCFESAGSNELVKGDFVFLWVDLYNFTVNYNIAYVFGS